MKLSDAEKGGSGLQLGMQERMSLYRNPDGSITIARQVKGQVRPDILGILDEESGHIVNAQGRITGYMHATGIRRAQADLEKADVAHTNFGYRALNPQTAPRYIHTTEADQLRLGLDLRPQARWEKQWNQYGLTQATMRNVGVLPHRGLIMSASQIYNAILDDEADMPESHAYYRLLDGTVVHTAQEEWDTRWRDRTRRTRVAGDELHQRVLLPGTKRINTSTGRALRARRAAGEKVGFFELDDVGLQGPQMTYE